MNKTRASEARSEHRRGAAKLHTAVAPNNLTEQLCELTSVIVSAVLCLEEKHWYA